MTQIEFHSFIKQINKIEGDGIDTVFPVEEVDGFLKKLTFFNPQKNNERPVNVIRDELSEILENEMDESVKGLWSSLYIFESKPFEIVDEDEPPVFTKTEYNRLILPLIRNKALVRLSPDKDVIPNYWGDIELGFTNLSPTKKFAKSLILMLLEVPLFFISGRIVVELETKILLSWGYDLYVFNKNELTL